jgi:hypothetical protein
VLVTRGLLGWPILARGQAPARIFRLALLGNLTRFELAVNVKTATTLGINVPPAVLQLADQVVR